MTDFLVRDCGSIVQIQPLTKGAFVWVESQLETEPWQWLGPTLNIDRRFAGDIIRGMKAAGLKEDV